MPADLEALPIARQAILSLGFSAGISGEVLHDAEIAANEALANAVEHAFGPEGGLIEMALTNSSRGLELFVTDRGRGMPPAPFAPVPDEEGKGLGMLIINSVSAEAAFAPARGGGTEVAMRFEGGGGAEVGAATGVLESIVAGAVSTAAAEAGLTNGPVDDALIVAGAVTRSGRDRLVGHSAEIQLDWAPGVMTLRIGHLLPDDAAAAIEAARGRVSTRLQVNRVAGSAAGEAAVQIEARDSPRS